tara:strand:- start:1775 stop:2725 length:951 start_codon:yes stop_codon:yes gene_type:complete
MNIDKYYLDEFIKVTQEAAISTFSTLGKKNKKFSDKVATDTMRKKLNKINMKGRVVIGEGEIDNAPMLYIGESLGTLKGNELDIAVDPLEGTNFAANNLPGAISVIAVTNKNQLLNAPETYMNKIAYGAHIKDEVIDLDFSFKKNIENLADYNNKNIENLTICILDRPRHKKIIDEAQSLKVKIKLITDGDVSGALLVSDKKYKIDLFLGIGGGPEGVIAACALDALNCGFQGRLIFDNEISIKRAEKMGIKDLNKKYKINEIVKDDSIFCATGITNGDLTKGVKFIDNFYETDTFVTHKSQKIAKNIKKNIFIKE